LTNNNNLINKEQVSLKFKVNIIVLYQELVNKQLKTLTNSFVSIIIIVNNSLKTNKVLFYKILLIIFWSFKKVLYINTNVFK
jgi:hypothetical protein